MLELVSDARRRGVPVAVGLSRLLVAHAQARHGRVRTARVRRVGPTRAIARREFRARLRPCGSRSRCCCWPRAARTTTSRRPFSAGSRPIRGRQRGRHAVGQLPGQQPEGSGDVDPLACAHRLGDVRRRCPLIVTQYTDSITAQVPDVRPRATEISVATGGRPRRTTSTSPSTDRCRGSAHVQPDDAVQRIE